MNEIEKLHNMLNEIGIEHEFGSKLDGHYIKIYNFYEPFEMIVDTSLGKFYYWYEDETINVKSWHTAEEMYLTIFLNVRRNTHE